MIEINLLPEELRKRKRAPLNLENLDFEMDKLKLLIGGIFVGCLVLLIVILSAGSFIRKSQIMRLKAKESLIAPQKSQVEMVDKEVNLLKNKLKTVGEITKRRFLWSQKLNELSDMVLPGIWFTRIYTDSSERLMIQGSVISKKEEAMATVGKFIKNIRAHSSFFKDFSNIELKTVQRRSIDDKDVVDFTIALYF
ncbi:MAG: PilN domain-containing protein [Candidatus Omnitrophica bacterium]|nr:PilN domain-containing protein [Candidatus Omnitrophota bacterium]MBU1853394.1 PilN domain-containing protein [Candidatus Omnitrophota bacterium]